MDEIDYTNSIYEYEPMDVDLSAHSNMDMDISYNLSDEKINISENVEICRRKENHIPKDSGNELLTENNIQPSSIKKYHIIMPQETDSHNVTKIKIISCLFVLCLSITMYQVFSIQCGASINLNELRSDLSSKLYGQSRAIHSLIAALDVREENKILFLFGGTGVGKTYTTSIILEQLGHNANVYHYTMPSFATTFTTDFMIGLTLCKHTTVIVDDLNYNDVEANTHIKDLISKSQTLKKNVTVILIYNCDTTKDFEMQCDETFSNRLLRVFSDVDSFKMLIKFETLKEEHLKKCIEKELGNRKLSPVEFDKFSKNFNVSVDGCKGVYTKMKVLGIS